MANKTHIATKHEYYEHFAFTSCVMNRRKKHIFTQYKHDQTPHSTRFLDSYCWNEGSRRTHKMRNFASHRCRDALNYIRRTVRHRLVTINTAFFLVFTKFAIRLSVPRINYCSLFIEGWVNKWQIVWIPMESLRTTRY